MHNVENLRDPKRIITIEPANAGGFSVYDRGGRIGEIGFLLAACNTPRELGTIVQTIYTTEVKLEGDASKLQSGLTLHLHDGAQAAEAGPEKTEPETVYVVTSGTLDMPETSMTVYYDELPALRAVQTIRAAGGSASYRPAVYV